MERVVARCWRRSGPGQVLAKMRALDAQKEFAGVPLARVEDLEHADAIVFGTPTRLGNMCGPMRQFLAATSQVWVSGALVGKIRSVFTSSNTQHGGQESTLLTVHTTLPHQGMVVVGLPYSFEGQMRMDEISGCSTYGASTIAGARFQRRHLASLAARLAAR